MVFQDGYVRSCNYCTAVCTDEDTEPRELKDYHLSEPQKKDIFSFFSVWFDIVEAQMADRFALRNSNEVKEQVQLCLLESFTSIKMIMDLISKLLIISPTGTNGRE